MELEAETRVPRGARDGSRSVRWTGSTSSVASLDRTIEAVQHQDIELAELVVADDDVIDGRYLEVHQSILTLLATQAPGGDRPAPDRGAAARDEEHRADGRPVREHLPS